VGVCVGVDEPSLEKERGVEEADIMEDGELGLDGVKVDLRRSLFCEDGDAIRVQLFESKRSVLTRSIEFRLDLILSSGWIGR
jgi:hypothetical protein